MTEFTIIVVGAGIVGASVALALQQDGHGVTLLERDKPGVGAHSRILASQLGDQVPLDTERGYHLMLAPDNSMLLNRPVVNGDSSFVLYPFGHQHLGMTLGPATGLIIADLVSGRDPSIDLAPYRPDRF